LTKGKQKSTGSDSKPKKTKGKCKRKIHESDLPTYIDEKELYDDDGDDFTDRDACLI